LSGVGEVWQPWDLAGDARESGRDGLFIPQTRPTLRGSHFSKLNNRPAAMNDSSLTTINFDLANEPLPSDPGANPFKLVVDPVMRVRLRRALFDMIETHDQELARYVAEGTLALDSYKEYIELFAHSLKQTMGSTEGVAYLLQACGFEVRKEEVNLQPETRWKVQR
jgi:hypothetical protein